MRLVPRPRGPDYRVDLREPGGPAELLARLVRQGVQHGGIAGPAWTQRPWHLSSGYALDGEPSANLTQGSTSVVNLKLNPAKPRLEQLANAEWLMSS